MGPQPLPRVLELAASKAAHFPAFDHTGAANTHHLDGATTMDAPESAGPGTRADGRKRVAQLVSIASGSKPSGIAQAENPPCMSLSRDVVYYSCTVTKRCVEVVLLSPAFRQIGVPLRKKMHISSFYFPPPADRQTGQQLCSRLPGRLFRRALRWRRAARDEPPLFRTCFDGAPGWSRRQRHC